MSGDKEIVKGHTTRLFKWNQKFISNTLNIILPLWGILVYHVKIILLQSSGIIQSTKEGYGAAIFNPALLFMSRESAECIIQTHVASIAISQNAKDSMVKDMCDYLFGCFKIESNMFHFSKRLPVIVSDLYLTRQMGDEDLGHVGKRKKISYVCGFKDINDTIKQHICDYYSICFVRENITTRNKGLLRICPALKEKNSKYTTDDPLCAICLTGYDRGQPVMVGPCSHKFHRTCLLKWLPGSCPMCRGSLTRDFII